jgi:hypothetical protein
MTRRRFLAPFALASLAGLLTGIAACGPTGPAATDGLPAPSVDGSPGASQTPDRTIVVPSFKPGSTEPPILTLEPPPPVVP